LFGIGSARTFTAWRKPGKGAKNWVSFTVIRPSFTLGGTGGGIAYKLGRVEYLQSGLKPPTNELLIKELLGWKEYEMEVVRDSADNCINVCSILTRWRPHGRPYHRGASANAQRQYQILRNASLACQQPGVDTGGSNVVLHQPGGYVLW
jgi:carbamoyl-phosphate synthase large subunit